MSRAERRAYERMNKNQDRYAVPAGPGARVRMERMKAKREAARSARDLSFTRRYVTRSLVSAFLVGLLAFSLQWSNGPVTATIVGLVVGVIWLSLAIGLRLLQQRSAR